MEKVKVTQDFLFEYLKSHDVNRSTLAKIMRTHSSVVNGCFLHCLDKYGKPRNFTSRALPKLNAALEQIGNEMRQCIVSFGSSDVYFIRGIAFDPACMSAVKQLSRFFNLTAFALRVLGWNENKKNAVLSAPSSKIYGHITRDDVDRINAELLSVAGVLSSYEVVEDDDKKNAAPDIPGKEFSDADLDAYEEELLLSNS